MTLGQFLIFWTQFLATHTCQVWQPDPWGTGNHLIYGGNCIDSFTLGVARHWIVTWAGASQGMIHF